MMGMLSNGPNVTTAVWNQSINLTYINYIEKSHQITAKSKDSYSKLSSSSSAAAAAVVCVTPPLADQVSFE